MSPGCIEIPSFSPAAQEPALSGREAGGPHDAAIDHEVKDGAQRPELPVTVPASADDRRTQIERWFDVPWYESAQRRAQRVIECDRQRVLVRRLRDLLDAADRAVTRFLERNPDSTDLAQGWDRQLTRLLDREDRLRAELASAARRLAELESAGWEINDSTRRE
jgi:hypothetical protein